MTDVNNYTYHFYKLITNWTQYRDFIAVKRTVYTAIDNRSISIREIGSVAKGGPGVGYYIQLFFRRLFSGA